MAVPVHASSLRSSRADQGTVLAMGWTRTKTKLDYWSLRCKGYGMAQCSGSWLSGDKCGPAAPEAALLPQQFRAEPPGNGWDIGHGIPGGSPLFLHSKSYHSTSNLPICVSLTCISCNNVKKSYFLQQQNHWVIRQYHFYFFEETPYCFPQWLYQSAFSPTVHKGSLFSTSSPALVCWFIDDSPQMSYIPNVTSLSLEFSCLCEFPICIHENFC